MITLVPNSALAELNQMLLVRGITLPPEYATIQVTSQIFGLSRTEIFRLNAEKKIVSIHYKTRPGARKGVRLIQLDSVRSLLQTLAEDTMK
jgi:hypothetical protein